MKRTLEFSNNSFEFIIFYNFESIFYRPMSRIIHIHIFEFAIQPSESQIFLRSGFFQKKFANPWFIRLASVQYEEKYQIFSWYIEIFAYFVAYFLELLKLEITYN